MSFQKGFSSTQVVAQENYQQTISKARELLLIYSRSSGAEQANQVLVNPSNDRLEKLEETLHCVTQQLATLSKPSAITQHKCFTCGQPGHLARECRCNRVFSLWSQRILETELLAAGKWPRERLQALSRGCFHWKLNTQSQEIVPALSDSLRTKAALNTFINTISTYIVFCMGGSKTKQYCICHKILSVLYTKYTSVVNQTVQGHWNQLVWSGHGLTTIGTSKSYNQK